MLSSTGFYGLHNDLGQCNQWRSKGGGNGDGPPRAELSGGAAKLHLHLKIWKGEKYFEANNFLW